MRLMRSLCMLTFVFTMLAGISSGASAQGWAGPPVLVPQALVDVVDLNRNANRVGDSSDKTSPLVANPAALRFTPNLSARHRNLAGFVAKTRAQSPENADQMEQLFGSTDIFATIAKALAPNGLRVDNVADAYTVYWITAWETSRGIIGSDTSRAQAQAVKAQVSRALLAAPEFTKANSAQKQELAEALLIQTALISASAEAAANDPAQMEALGIAVRQGAKAMGLDLDAMELSETGFKPVS